MLDIKSGLIEIEILENPKGDEWIRCGYCDDWFCVVHDRHAHECSCISLWMAEMEQYKIIERGDKLFAHVPKKEYLAMKNEEDKSGG